MKTQSKTLFTPRKTVLFITYAAIIAALYAVLTLVGWEFSSMQIQVRLSEALCVLPLFSGAAVPGLFIGCFLANILAGNVIDAIFGSLTTLAAAALTYLIGRALKKIAAKVALGPLPAVILNAIAVPLILYYGYGITSFGDVTGTLPVLGLTALSVAIGQVIACYGIGVPLCFALKAVDDRTHLFHPEDRRKKMVPDNGNKSAESES